MLTIRWWVGDHFFGNPHYWCSALAEIPTLAPRTWLDGHLMDFYLAHRFATLAHPSNAVYLPVTVGRGTQQFDDFERDLYQRLYPRESILGKAITFLLLLNQHYFVVVFHYQLGISVTYGRQWSNVTEEFTAHDDWNRWDGQRLWTSIADLLGLSGQGTLRQSINLPSVMCSFQWNQVCAYIALHESVWKTKIEFVHIEWKRLWCYCHRKHRTLHGPWS